MGLFIIGWIRGIVAVIYFAITMKCKGFYGVVGILRKHRKTI